MRPIPVFVNGAGVEVAPGATALDAVREWRAESAMAVARGELRITDSRGLPLPAGAPLAAGSILRLAPVREPAEPGAERSAGAP